MITKHSLNSCFFLVRFLIIYNGEILNRSFNKSNKLYANKLYRYFMYMYNCNIYIYIYMLYTYIHISIVCIYTTLSDLFYSWFSHRSNNFYLYQRVNWKCIESYIHTAVQYQIINANVSEKIIEYLCCILNLFQQFIDSLTSNRARCLLSICDNNDEMHINNGNIVCTGQYCLLHKTSDKKKFISLLVSIAY